MEVGETISERKTLKTVLTWVSRERIVPMCPLTQPYFLIFTNEPQTQKANLLSNSSEDPRESDWEGE